RLFGIGKPRGLQGGLGAALAASLASWTVRFVPGTFSDLSKPRERHRAKLAKSPALALSV
ncbi:MAG: hypothetical protein KDA84_03210, partial [Planctomycetaceae bacterium]|nr:hypothetical protein [Planctomycetaceae bacterium]